MAALRGAAVDGSAGSRRRAAVGSVVLGAGVVAVLVSAVVARESVLTVAGLGAVACLVGLFGVG